MSTDKLAHAISPFGGPNKSQGWVDFGFAADRVREAFVVIDRNDLLGVETVTWGGKVRAVIDPAPGPAGSVEWHESKAREHLSLAEHLRANPPVDEKAVAELTDRLLGGTAVVTQPEARDLARRLIADGWKREVTS